jgi:CubicO group peptidase (beta-lactamase class C family)
LAFAPGAGSQESVDLERAESVTFKMNPAQQRSFARVGRHRYGVAHSIESSGAVAPTRLEVSLFDEQLFRTKTLWSVREGESWDHVELVAQSPDAEDDGRVWLFRYQARDGTARLNSFTADGLQQTRGLDLPAGLTDFELSVVGGELRILAVDEEGVLTLRASRIEAMVQHLRRGLERRPGYEFALMQSGHVLHAEAGGWAEVPSSARPLGRPMTTDTRLNVASISKLVTAVTVLRLRDAGFLDLDEEFIRYLSERRREELDASWHGLTVRELLTHSSSAPETDCEVGHDGIPDCSAMLSAERELWRCEDDEDGHPCCPRVYANSNYQLLRVMLEDLLELHSNEDIAEYTSLDWLEAIGVEGAGCTPDDDDRYYRRIGPTFDALETVTPSQGGGCGQSGWHMSALDLIRIARALRYQWVLSPESSAELFSCAENGLLAWDSGWAGLASRGKSGRLRGTIFSTQSVIARLPSDIDVVIVTNSVDSPSPADLVRGMWFAN